MKSGYYLDLPKVGRTKLTRKFYTEDTKPILLKGQECVPAKTAYIGKLSQELDDFFKQSGGASLLDLCFKNLMYLLAPLGKTQLAAIIGLLVLNYLAKRGKQYGGDSSYIGGMEATLLPMDKSILLTTAGLLLLQYFLSKERREKKSKKSKKSKKGKDRLRIFENTRANIPPTDIRYGINDVPIFLKGGKYGNKFANKLIKILDKKHRSGNLLYENMMKTIKPLHGKNININTSLLYKLDNAFKLNSKSKKLYGGRNNLIDILETELSSYGLNNNTAGVIMMAREKKYKKKKGGYPSSFTSDYVHGYEYGQGYAQQQNCGKGRNALEVVGDKALDYSKNLKQFGCEIPEWGYNLFGKNCTKCI